MKKFLAMFALAFVLLPTVVFAQAAATPPATTPTTTSTTTSANPCSLEGVNGTAGTTSLPRCVNQIYVWSLGLAVLLAMLMIVIGGYYYMTSGGNAEQSSKGKEYITSALIGIVILFCAYLLLYQINPDLVNFNLKSLDCLTNSTQKICSQNTPTTPPATTPTGTQSQTQTPARTNTVPDNATAN